MKKCRQCGMLSADTAVVCRHCNVKFTEDDKPIIVKEKKKKNGIFAVIGVVIAVIGIAVFTLHQSGMLKTWLQASEKKDLKIIAEEFIQADFEKNAETIRSFMFDEYINYHDRMGTFSLDKDKYVSFYFYMYNPECSIKILSVESNILEDDFQLYANEIISKYAVTPTKIARVDVEVQITDGELSQSTTAPLTVISLNKEWFVMPLL